MVILDTNVIIDHLRLQGKKDSELKKIILKHPKKRFAVSVLTIQELYEGKSTKDTKREEYMIATLASLKLLPYTYEVAKLAGEIARDIKNNIEFADAAIAATAIINGAQLVTLNKKDFQKIPDLEMI